MTDIVVASAPGKVILSGEYAVLDGAPAICMAVGRRARVTLSGLAGDTFEVSAPGFSDQVSCFRLSADGDDRIQWTNAGDALRIVDSVFRAANVQDFAAQAIDLNTVEFADAVSGAKMGIGSSAALTVALCSALLNSADAAAIQGIALRAHADLQGDVGSGTDIACSIVGGLIDYRMKGSTVTRLDWPEKLSYRLIWTGSASSTTDKLAKLDAGASMPSRVRLAGASEAMAATWRSGDAVKIINDYADYCEVLHKFSIDHDLGIFDAGHSELWHTAKAMDLIYKPCGAGGGDVGIVLGLDDAAIEEFASKLTPDQAVLDARLSDTGVRVEKLETGQS